MEEYNKYNMFLQPEKPFLLIYTDTDDSVSYAWLESEEDLQEVIKEVTSYGCKIQDAIEIGSVREIKKKSELKGAEKYGDCNSCSKRSGETDLYQIEFHYDDSTKNHTVNLCFECMCELGNMIYDIYQAETEKIEEYLEE